jgi:hypothetical protein
MNKGLKFLIALSCNLLLAGFFGLGCAILNMIWLEFAIKHFPAVSYTQDYQMTFGTACAAGFMIVALFRMMQSRLDSMFPQGIDIGILLVLISVCMMAFTPVPNSHFFKYLVDRSTLQSQGAAPSPGTADLPPKSPETK